MKKKKTGNTVAISPRKDNLKRRLRRHLRSIGLRHGDDGALEAEGTGKDIVRALDHAQRAARLRGTHEFISESLT